VKSLLAAGTLALAFLLGCRAGGPRAPTGPLPEYATIAAAYNARLEPIQRLWARAVTRVWYPDEHGEENSEQLEGFFQYIRARSVLILFDKVGLSQTFAVFGSNDTHYWWIELLDEKVMHLGTHAGVTPQRVRELGLPVHPLELLEVLGLVPLPGPEVANPPTVSRDAQGLIVVDAGRRRVRVEDGTFLPRLIELLDERGAVAVSAKLSHEQEIDVPFPAQGPHYPMTFDITGDGGRARVKIELSEPTTTRREPVEGSFDPEGLARRFRVERRVDLDAPPGPRP